MSKQMADEKYYKAMLRIRRFEEQVLDAFPSGLISGTTHTYLGQEANAVGVLSHLAADDIVFSNHRCHGHFLAYGGGMSSLFAELMGKPSGVSGGRGGSQHIHWKNFYSNGVLGSTVPIATGAAMAERFQESGKLVVIFLGDGALGQGVLYESLNIASLQNAPILFVVENNHIAQTTPIEIGLAGDISARFAAFDIEVSELDSSEVAEIAAASKLHFDAIRDGNGPRALIIHTQRFGPHSKGDDTRDADEVQKMRDTRDPLQLGAIGLSEDDVRQVEKEVASEVEAAFEQAKAAPQWEAQ
jgi:TPP-dependent pyruvate/acetoin dehydrogenase alpha subunit